jgi:benzylsuccinate CoA-transferase BbsF subunit
VTRRLVEWGDVFVDNFTPGIMARWGLDYESLRKIRPDIITLSISQLGNTGPLSTVSGTGTNLVGMAGFTAITGWPDREPVQPFGGYPDFISGAFGASALIGALIYRKRTGKGQMLEISQLESATQFLTFPILDYVVRGEKGRRKGNRWDYAAPNGIYPCKGDDEWCAISVVREEDWRGFCKAIGNPPWSEEPRFSSLSRRKENEDELDTLVSGWTKKFAAKEVMTTLQAQGIAAGSVQSPKDLVEDPQLQARNSFWELEHPEIGPFLHLGELFRLHQTPASGEMPSPCLGEHLDHVCREMLNIPEDEFTSLLLDGVFE